MSNRIGEFDDGLNDVQRNVADLLRSLRGDRRQDDRSQKHLRSAERGKKRKMITLLLTVELYGTDSTRRRQFNAEMARREWVKVSNMRGTFCAGFDGDLSESDAIRLSQEDVIEAAEHARIDSWRVVCQASTSPPVAFTAERRTS